MPSPVEDIARARASSTVNIEAVRSYLYGGGDKWKDHEKVERTLASDPVFEKSKKPWMSRQELFEATLAQTSRIYELEERLSWTPEMTSRALNLLDDGTPLLLHHSAFAPVFASQASPELLRKYGALTRMRGIIGCYLQTELGHGSNVARLETTATYIPASREFEIHSPTFTSRKWWIGSLGSVATHGVVQAKLILPDGQDVGPHLFFIQLRSLEDHTVMPGISIGDIGPKAFNAWGATDHGFAIFDHVRIPREHMLSKFAQVTDEGKYVRPPHAKISFGGVRSIMVTAAGWSLAKAATISIRYAHLRRQGNVDSSGTEQQVIYYPSTYYRLLPILARAYVFIPLGDQIARAFTDTVQKLAEGNTSLLAEMHVTTCGLKVLTSTATARDIETARRSMGGHGFSVHSGLSRLYGQYLPATTYEGDNFVLDHQVVRAALKAHAAVCKSTAPPALSPSAQYLRLLGSPPALFSGSWTDPAQLALLLEQRAACVVDAYANSVLSGAQDAGASNRVSATVTGAFVAAQVVEMVKRLPMAGLATKDIVILSKLYTLYLTTEAEGALADLFAFKLLPTASSSNHDPAADLRAAITRLCLDLLPEVIGLTDAFGFTDWQLDSALGTQDGRVYEELVERAKAEPMNTFKVTPTYEIYIRPILQRGQQRAKRDAKL
ncbi:peroxisomal oxidase [Vararia minispora EC-137]|uniref:Peroxisomal oxidase n=1 Tax=Vararia minispora EC-137 TaxID=1314806 RepID=A0ACB8Q7X6_9AGAM|nr:peroxisomal oxidase [Vararia minispora EC-137]